MKGIILAGGLGTRLYPLTKSISKQIIPIYDKPMIYYPLSVLMLAGIRDILIISTPRDIVLYKELFRDGSELGLSFFYNIQTEPNGLAEAFIIGKNFIGNDSVALILGDNLFYGQKFNSMLSNASARETGATIFGYYVKDPSSYGVIVFDENQNPIAIEEKPRVPKSHYAVPGLYFYDNQVVDIAHGLKPSARGELEITDVNNWYIQHDQMHVELFDRGMAWLDTGTHTALLQAANYVETVQKRQGMYIACIEEIAWQQGFITCDQLLKLAKPLLKTEYGQYLIDIAQGA